MTQGTAISEAGMHVKRIAAGAAALVCLAAAAAGAAPQSITATYDFSFAGISVGELSETYRREGDRYRIDSVARPNRLAELFFPTFRESSSGSVTPRGLRPETFSHSRSDDDSKTRRAEFDWSNRSVSLTFDGRSETQSVAEATQDALSMKYQFQFAPPTPGESAISMTDGKKVTTYRYRFVREETVETPAGRFETVHYAKIAEAGDSRFELWLSKADHFLPVKILGEEKGRTAIQTLTRYSTE
jgi:Protein of unknown function (DUF3108)/Family of unknown function (DUF6134)